MKKLFFTLFGVVGLLASGCVSTSPLTKGDQMMSDGQYSWAIAQYEKSLKKRESYDGHLKKGLAHYRLSENAKAIEEFTAAIKVEPVHSANAYFYRAKISFSANQTEEAFSDIQESLIRNGNNMYALNLRGQIYMQKGENVRALNDFMDALSKSKNSNTSALLHNNIALAFIEISDYEAAKEHFTKYIFHLSDNEVIIEEDDLYLKGVLEYGTGNYETAFATWDGLSKAKSSYAMGITDI